MTAKKIRQGKRASHTRAAKPVVHRRVAAKAHHVVAATRQAKRSPILSRRAGIVSWQAPDFHLHPKSWTWSVFMVAIGATAAILFALFNQYILAVIVFLASLVMALGTSDQPQILIHTITPRGLLINQWLLSWDDVKSFWVVGAPEGNKLYLQTIKRGLPIVTVYLGESNPEVVRAELLKYLPEHPTRGEQLTDILARLLKV